MKASMSAETEKERQDQEREKKSPTETIYQKIVRRIKELLRIPEQNQTNEQKQELKDLKTARRASKLLFRERAPRYVPQVDKLIEEANQKIGQAIEAARNASAAAKPAKDALVSDLIRDYKQKAVKLGCEEPNLPADLQGIGQTDLEEAIASLEEINNKTLNFTPGQAGVPEGNAAGSTQNKDVSREIEKKTAQLREWGYGEEEAKRLGQDMVLRPASYYGYSAAELEVLKNPGEKGIRAREDMFDDLFAIVDSQSAVSFHEALASQNTMYKLNQFFEVLKDLPGSKQLIDEYGTKQKLRMMLHNSAYLVEHGGGKPQQFEQMMEQFTPELFDQLFMYPEVDTAVHLYEIGVETFRSRNDNFLPWEQMVYNPKKGLNEIDAWVMERFKEVVRKKHKPPLSEEEFRSQWPEKKIMKTLALARGFEITTVRFPEMSARSRLPKGPGAMISPPYEDFVRPLEPFEHFTEKFLTRDPGAAWLMFTITDGAILPDASKQDIDDYFNRNRIDPQHLHMMDIVNFLEIGGPFTQSSWRSLIAMRNVSEEDKKWMGLSFGKYLIEEDCKMDKFEEILDEKLAEKAAFFGVERLSGEDKKHFYERVKKAGDDLKRTRTKDLFEKTLKRNPIRILREAELGDGEILDLDVQAMVLEKTLRELYGSGAEAKIEEFAARRRDGETDKQFSKRISEANKTTDRKKFIDDTENVLIVLTQLGVAKRKEEIDFADVDDPEKRKAAEAYYRAISEVVHQGKRKWLKGNKVVEEKDATSKLSSAWLFGDLYKEKNPKEEPQETSIMEYLYQKKFPFTPGFDDAPFNLPEFIKMGQKGFSRRIRDYMGAQKGMMAMLEIQNNFGKLRKGEQVVGALDKFWQGIREYDKDKAKEKMTKLYEGVCKFNAANKPRRFLPFPLDVVNEFISNSHWFGAKETSYARNQFGYAANSWRGVDMYNLLGMARMAGHITREQEMELRKKLRCDVGNLISEYACRGWLVGVVFITGLWVQEALKQIQEQSKET